MFLSLPSSTPWKTRQFCREYCSKSSMSDERLFYFSTKFSMAFSNWLTCPSFFLISFSRSSNYADINSSDSVTLIWDSFASSWKVKSFFTSFSILLNNLQLILLIPESFNHLKKLCLAENLNCRFLLLSLNPLHLATCQRDLFFCFLRKSLL